MRRFGLTIAAVSIGLLSAAEGASACSCVGPESIYKDSARLAFTGRLLTKDDAGRGERYTYRVTRVFKTTEKVDLTDGDEITLPVSLIVACGFPQKEGERYGVMATRYKRGEKLQANGCTMTSAESLRRIARKAGDARATVTDGCGAVA